MSDAVKSRWNWPHGLSAIAPWRSRGVDWRDTLAGADLPVPARDLIGRVIRRTRLWPAEKVELTEEVISHFADGLAAGENLADLLQKFGDERLAARLMSRAARRKRNPVIRAVAAMWTALRWTLGVALALFTLSAIVYIVLVIIFVTGVPSPKVDYLKMLNAEALKTPVAQRAWPMYRDAAMHMQLSNALLPMLFAHPGDANWKSTQQWLTDHAGDLDLVRQASRKKELGFICGLNKSINDPALWPEGSDVWGALRDANDDGELLYRVPLPDMGVLSQLAGCLSADADLALVQNQPARVTDNLIAIFNIADHIQWQGGGTAMYMSRNLRIYAISQLERILRDTPTTLRDADLIALSHRIAGPQVAADFFHWPIDRLAFLDLLQYVYTDNGHGNGRPTERGWSDAVAGWHDYPQWEDYAAWPFLLLFTPSRHQEIVFADRLNGEISKNMHLPRREANWKPFDKEVTSLSHFDLTNLVLAFGPRMRMHGTQEDYEKYLGERDGALVAIALERYRRAHGNYPPTLTFLLPNYLPSIPADRITGNPVKYRLIKGKPVVYSVGSDRHDDGGATVTFDTGDGKTMPLDSADWDFIPKNPQQGAGGDWLLFPDVYLDYYQQQGATKFMASWFLGPLYRRD